MEDVADREPGVANVERGRLEARSAARLARRDDVRQERHLRDDDPLPVARRAAPPRGRVEREARRRVAARPRLGEGGEELADLVPDAEERRGHGARRPADGRLVDGQRALHRLVPFERRVLPGLLRHEAERAAERRIEDVPHERGLARAAHSGDDAHAPHGHAERHVLAGCARARPRARSTRRPADASVGPRERLARARARSASCGSTSTFAAAPSATMCPPFRPPPGPRSMTWSAARMVSASCSTTSTVEPRVDQRAQVREERLRVARVEADGRLVEDVERAGEPAPELRARDAGAASRRPRASPPARSSAR